MLQERELGIEMVLSYGAVDVDGKALETAACQGDEKAVKLLLSNGKTVRPENDFSRTLEQASENGHVKIVEMLLLLS